MWIARRPCLTKPGLFITATDTEVGKTVITCAIAHAMCQLGYRVGVCKPFASGCRQDHDSLISPDAQALAHFSQCRQPLNVINPIRYAAPLAPAVAAQQSGNPPDTPQLATSLETIDATSDVLLVEGIGGLLVPLNQEKTVLDLVMALGYPVLIVTRAGLGTLNHTAMTLRLLRQSGCQIAGLVVNQTTADSAKDPSITSNLQWLTHMNQTPILATVPASLTDPVRADEGHIPQSILQAVATIHWPDVLAAPGASGKSF